MWERGYRYKGIMEEHENIRGETSVSTLHSFLLVPKYLKGKWSHHGSDGSNVKFGNVHVSMMAHSLSSRSREIDYKSDVEGYGDVRSFL
jgi:hypothetical protein